jgi:CPA2 family monovalent cation:H+ antiporter-2
MPHETPLIATIVAGLGLAFIFGAIASRLRLPPLVGYLLAGIVVGPHTPGFVADQALAGELAELGVIPYARSRFRAPSFRSLSRRHWGWVSLC